MPLLHGFAVCLTATTLCTGCLQSREGTQRAADGQGAADTSAGPDVTTDARGPDGSTPRLVLQPAVVDFEGVPVGAESVRQLALVNAGTADLVVDRLALSGHPGFLISRDGETWRVDADSAHGIDLDPPVVIPPGETDRVEVAFSASGPEAAEGRIVFVNNGADREVAARLYANSAGPCVAVRPGSVDFGGRTVGQVAAMELEIRSCGDSDLQIDAVSFIDDADGAFSVDTSSLGDLPAALPPGASHMIRLTYLPMAFAPIQGSAPVRDEGVLRIRTNARVSNHDVPVSGFGSRGGCPVAVITVAEGEEVIPQTELHLSGSRSTSPNGRIVSYAWDPTQPQGGVSRFSPGATSESPSFEANLVGEYVFRLSVVDEQGTRSCQDATFTVLVTTGEAIHVELLWTTPGDPDESDEGERVDGISVGSDVDLHFAHPDAVEPQNPSGWFHSTFDVSWCNPNPNWGESTRSDDPRLDRDDVDGAGPENLNFTYPEGGQTYRIGVHYYDDWSFGESLATVRIFIFGQERLRTSPTKLISLDMWEVATVDWPSGAVTELIRDDGTPDITPAVLGFCL